MTNTNNLLIINRFTNNVTKKVFSKAHVLDLNTLDIIKSYPKFEGDSLAFFNDYESILITEVSRSSLLDTVNIIKR